jgi:peroxiredoxin
MARTNSTMLPLGTPAPLFSLTDVVTGNAISAAWFIDKDALLVIFLCVHCPYVKHVQDELVKIGRDYAETPLGILAVSSNDAVQYPDDGPEGLKAMAETLGFTFPVCYDESQDVAKSFAAACTPDFFLFDAERKLVYRGQLDESRPKMDPPVPVTGASLRAAIDAVLKGEEVNPDQRASLGCNIKWKAE